MPTIPLRRRARAAGALALLLLAGPALAGAGPRDDGRAHGHGMHRAAVLPPTARPHGYSLDDMARLTAAFNVDRSRPVPNTPFQILYSSPTAPSPFRVGQGTILYVPVAYNDDSLPVIGDFPADIENRRQLLKYWYSPQQWGSVYMEIVVDGKTTPLGPRYLSGVHFTQPLPDGALNYMTPAAFVGPLRPGAHTVEIRLKATGDAFREEPVSEFFPDGFFEFSVVYDVLVN